jgi:hypothetical protein
MHFAESGRAAMAWVGRGSMGSSFVFLKEEEENPAFATDAPTIKSLAAVLQALVAAGRIANTRTCLNLSKSHLGDSDVESIAMGIRVLAKACPEVCVVLRLTRLTATMPLQSLLNIPQLTTIDLCSTPFASTDSRSILAKLSASDAERLILVPNMSILGTALPALFSMNKAHLQASYNAHEVYYSRNPILRERLWIYERQDCAQRKLALAVKHLIAIQRQREKEAAETREENIRRMMLREQRREEQQALELARARNQRNAAVIAAVVGVVGAGLLGILRNEELKAHFWFEMKYCGGKGG